MGGEARLGSGRPGRVPAGSRALGDVRLDHRRERDRSRKDRNIFSIGEDGKCLVHVLPRGREVVLPVIAAR